MNFAITLARWLAIAIALLGVIDPAITSMRRVKPEIAIIETNRADSALARRVSEKLDDDFTVVRGPYSAAMASVIVGDALPEDLPTGLVFGVQEQRPVAIRRVDVPSTATAEARIPVAVIAEPAGREVTLDVRAGGVVVDRATLSPSGSPALLYVTPTVPGVLSLSVTARSGSDSATADVALEVEDRQRAILFYDRRPSWMSTFVRRALERDRRFAVASRVITSKGISTDAGQPPSSLSDPSVLELYDVIVVGAPTSLTPADVNGLEVFLRRRGGAVVLLYDERVTSSPVDRLTGASRWTTATTQTPVFVEAIGDSATMKVTEFSWPAMSQGGLVDIAKVQTGANPPSVWSAMVGQGEVIVSGALDAWKFRDPATSRFEEFWTGTIDRAAREAVPALSVKLSTNLAEPGDEIKVTVTTRDTTITAAEARIEATGASAPIRLWTKTWGVLEGRLSAPAAGTYRITATAGGARAARHIVVAPSVNRATPDERVAIATLAGSSGGTVTDVNGIERALRAAVGAEVRRERWNPMRSAWWIVAFAGLLGVEWLVRRRRGLA